MATLCECVREEKSISSSSLTLTLTGSVRTLERWKIRMILRFYETTMPLQQIMIHGTTKSFCSKTEGMRIADAIEKSIIDCCRMRRTNKVQLRNRHMGEFSKQ
mmetsp:Transcript_34533/g.63479  ORF Transcript_34533/g.63479 Transcript_34533/m.63479 type:complete len:103 (+) Transcript_34533:2390-2698(+)